MEVGNRFQKNPGDSGEGRRSAGARKWLAQHTLWSEEKGIRDDS